MSSTLFTRLRPPRPSRMTAKRGLAGSRAPHICHAGGSPFWRCWTGRPGYLTCFLSCSPAGRSWTPACAAPRPCPAHRRAVTSLSPGRGCPVLGQSRRVWRRVNPGGAELLPVRRMGCCAKGRAAPSRSTPCVLHTSLSRAPAGDQAEQPRSGHDARLHNLSTAAGGARACVRRRMSPSAAPI